MEPLCYNRLAFAKANNDNCFASLLGLTIAKSFVRAVDCLDHLAFLEYLGSLVSPASLFSKRSVRVISIARLNRSLCVHLQPIYVVVYNYPIWNSYLVASFALRCFQRLSVPDLVTR